MRALGGRRPAAPHPRRGLPWRSTQMVALDFETTGLDPDADHVIAYGAVPIERGRVLVGSARSQLIRPPTPPSPTSQTIHLLRTVDLAGRRVGYGGGFYDRFLPRTRTHAFRVAVVLPEQLVREDLPAGAFDLRVHAIVTPDEVIRCAP